MGNTVNVKLKEETEKLEITEKLVRDFQYHINLVDRSVVSFARSLDSMRASCAVLQKDKKKAPDTNVGDGKSLPLDPEAALLLETIDEVVSDHKSIAMESLSRFFTFIIGIGGVYFTTEPEIILSVDKYRVQNTCHTDMDIQFCDARIESLQRTIKTLKEDNEISNKKVNILNEREELYQNEKTILKKTIKNLEDYLEDANSEKEDAIKENETLFKEKEVLTHEKGQMAYEKGKFENKIATLSHELTECITSNEEMKNDVSLLKKTNLDLRENCAKDSQTISTIKEENTSVVESLKNEIEKLKSKRSVVEQSLEKEIQKLKDSFEQEHSTKETLMKRLEDMEDEKRRQTEEKEFSDKQLDSFTAEIDSLQANVNENQLTLKNLEEKHKFQMDECLEQKEILQIEKMKTVLNIENMEAKLKSLTEENTNLTSELASNEVKAMKSLKEDIISTLSNTFKGDIKEISATLKQLHESEIKRLTESLQKETIAKDECVKQVDELKNEQHRYGKEKITSDTKLNQLQEKIRRLETELSKNESEIKALKEEHEDDLIKLKDKRNKSEELKQNIDDMHKKIDELDKKNCGLLLELQKEKDTKVTILEEKTLVITSLRTEIEDMKTKADEIKQLNEENKEKLAESMKQEMSKEEKTLKQIRQLTEKEHKLSKEVTQLNTEKTNLMKDVKEKEEQIDKLKSELESATKIVLPVQVRKTPGFRATSEERDLQNELVTRMAAQCIELKFLSCTDFTPLSTDFPLLIVCSKPTRTKRERCISNVLEGVKASSKMALLLFHEKDDKAFRKDMESSQGTSHGTEIFDIGYHKNEIYKSDINSKNIERLFSFINKEGVLKSRLKDC